MSAADVTNILQQAVALVAKAEAAGVCLTITREPLQPLAMGHARHVVEARPARHQPAPPIPEGVAYSALADNFYKDGIGQGNEFYLKWRDRRGEFPKPAPRPMSDREWAAMPANLREGCTTHAPGVGDL